MRTNGLNLTIQDGSVQSLVEEGYKTYDADGNFKGQCEDRLLAPEAYNDALKALADGECCIYALEKQGKGYLFTLDASNGRTYLLHIAGGRDMEEWERFLNP